MRWLKIRSTLSGQDHSGSRAYTGSSGHEAETCYIDTIIKKLLGQFKHNCKLYPERKLNNNAS